MAKLSPIVPEFETDEQAASYDRWFRAKVQASLAKPGPGVPHDEVMARMDTIIAQGEARIDMEGMTVLDADTAYQLLDNPPEPTEALRNLLALR